MRRILAAVGLLAALAPADARAQRRWTPPDAALVERARGLLREVPLIDTHNDLVYSIQEVFGGDESRIDLRRPQPRLAADIPRLRQGHVGAQFWAAYVASDSMFTGGALRHGLRSIDVVHRIIDRYDELEWARTADDIERAFRAGRIASLIGFEGGHAIEGSVEVLRMFHALGVRYLTLTHFLTIPWADAATDHPRHRGLTEEGEAIVREMNRLGMFVDISHVSDETMRDALRVSRAPVIFSHSSARGINGHVRNVPDDVLRLLPRNGGVVMVNFIAGYIAPDAPAWAARRDSVAEALRAELDDPAAIARRQAEWERRNPAPRGTVADVADHIDHIRKVAGIDHIGIGSDFYTDAPDAMAVGLEDPSTYPVLFAELLRRGYTDEDAKKIAGLNFLRAMREMERVAERLRAGRTSAPAGVPGGPR